MLLVPLAYEPHRSSSWWKHGLSLRACGSVAMHTSEMHTSSYVNSQCYGERSTSQLEIHVGAMGASLVHRRWLVLLSPAARNAQCTPCIHNGPTYPWVPCMSG